MCKSDGDKMDMDKMVGAETVRHGLVCGRERVGQSQACEQETGRVKEGGSLAEAIEDIREARKMCQSSL